MAMAALAVPLPEIRLMATVDLAEHLPGVSAAECLVAVPVAAAQILIIPAL
jgi:hypothetical protein